MSATPVASPPGFSGYQKAVAGMLAFLQFAVILDFMLMSPLGATIMPALRIGPAQFGLVVSAYAFSAAISGLLTAGFADRFDRKRILLFFYAGFVAGTAWCGLAQSFHSLLLARIVTGLFGGVIGSVVLAIAADLFPAQQRGRVMGLIQTAFAASQVLGIPIGLALSNRWDWHAPFLAMAGLGLLAGLVVAWRLQPVSAHLQAPREHGAWRHLLHTLAVPRHLPAFAATALLSIGGFMLMPFGSAFIVGNLGIDLHSLPTIYLITGLCAIVFGPLIGRATDRLGILRVFTFGTLASIVMVLIYTHLVRASLAWLIVVNVLLFAAIFSRMIPFQALAASVPPVAQRGAFNAIAASVQQLSGGLASLIAGQIVSVGTDGRLQHFEIVGYVVVAVSLVAWFLLRGLQRGMQRESHLSPTAAG